MFLYAFVILIAMKPKMLQNAIEEGKTKDVSVLQNGQKENKRGRGKILIVKKTKFQF